MFLYLRRRGGRVTGSRTGRTKTEERERWELGVDCDRWKEGEATGLCDLDVGLKVTGVSCPRNYHQLISET